MWRGLNTFKSHYTSTIKSQDKVIRWGLNVHIYGPTHTSSPSFRTMVPARSTTAKTMTAQSSLLTDMVMLANAGSWCMNSSNCSARGTKERQRRERRRLRKRANRVLTPRGENEDTQCSWQAYTALTSSQGGTSWRLSIKMDHHHNEQPTEESLLEHEAKYHFHWCKRSRQAKNNCWHFTRWPLCELNKLTADNWNHT